MEKFLTIIILLFAINTANAAKIDDAKVLDIKYVKDSFEVKLQVANAPKDSYFLVDIGKSDSDSFDKLALVLKKLKKPSEFKLSLDIPSFSLSPSGSYYRSESVTFSGTASGESLIAH